MNLLRSLEKANLVNEILWVVIAALSGRRFKDVSRITWQNVSIQDSVVSVLLMKDKANQSRFVSFGFDFDKWDLPDFSITSLVEKFKFNKMTKNCKEKVISVAKKHNIKNRCANLFRCHSLRNRASIKLIISGKSEEQVQAAIGWKSISSLYRYTVLSLTELQKFENYNQAYVHIMKNRNLK